MPRFQKKKIKKKRRVYRPYVKRFIRYRHVVYLSKKTKRRVSKHYAKTHPKQSRKRTRKFKKAVYYSKITKKRIPYRVTARSKKTQALKELFPRATKKGRRQIRAAIDMLSAFRPEDIQDLVLEGGTDYRYLIEYFKKHYPKALPPSFR